MAVACGVESMSRVPMCFTTAGRSPYGPSIAARYPDGLVPQGVSAELIAAKMRALVGVSSVRLEQMAFRAAA